ncbi:FAD-dependent oxidoreductase [Micromonospora sp. CPCC 206061]|uniref:FAD-dependent oxidoreductase n=1 Tax=Micromonospora sp. CPCC 206061 TaxID=3122410 RepID=UPI002FF0637D
MEKTDVLVVGGGLVGLSSALFLARAGVDVTLVERHPATSVHPRARGVNPRTVEILRGCDPAIEEAMRDTPSARALVDNDGVLAMTSLAGEQIAELDQPYLLGLRADWSALSPARWCLCDQDELEPILRDAARRHGADVRFGTALSSWDQDDDAVYATLRVDGADRAVRARYLIAADGVASPIRTTLGIGRTGHGTLAHYLSMYFRADLREPLRGRRFVLGYVVNDDVMGALVPVDNAERWLLHVPVDPEDEDVLDWPRERHVELIRAAAGVPDLDPEVIAVLPWEASGTVAERMRVGRAFLAGDAAHVMPPTGAFGSNTGIQDAHNLCWKLAAVLRGDAGPALLDSYESERLPVARRTVEQAVRRSQDRPRLVRAVDSRIAAGIVPDPVVMFGYRYGAGTDAGVFDVTGDGGPGTRLPHAWLEDGRSTLDLVDPNGFTLLVEGAAAPSVDGVRVHHGSPLGGAILVRPDGFVAWQGESADGAAAALASLLDR